MKRFIQKTMWCFVFLVATTQYAQAQKKFSGNANSQDHKHTGYTRCATEDVINERLKTDPEFKAMMDKRNAEYEAWKVSNAGNLNKVVNTSLLTGIVTIPVVFHVVMPNAQLIKDADCQYVIDRLNLDFSGLNPDSTNAVSFYPRRGHALIRFCLAKRDPAGNFTSGIDRRNSGTVSNTSGTNDPVKSNALGGLDSWNNLQYYNIWVSDIPGGILGYSNSIGPGNTSQDGVVLNFQSFSNSPCGTIPAFALGRTAVHEVGHNFGLYHIWGDNNACNDQDFRQLTGVGCTLPASLLVAADDTPAQNGATSGCPSGIVASGCGSAPNPPGKNYQNYMDYTDDPCYSMFTNGQVARMHYVLEFCRPGYLTSLGCVAPAATPLLDAAAVEVVSPGGSEVLGCVVTTYTAGGCSGTFTPKVRIQNKGLTTLTSVTVQLILNGVPQTAQVVSVNLISNASQVVTLTNANLVNGANSIQYLVSAPNGGVDAVASNNTVNTSVNYTAPGSVSAPIAQDFVAATFPPINWTVFNPNTNNTWVRNATGLPAASGSLFINNYNNSNPGQIDDFRTVVLNTGVTDSIIIEFDLAHKNYNANPMYADRLQVLTSSDCGATFQATSFDRSGAALATAGASLNGYVTPITADWRRQRVSVGKATGFPTNQILVAFRCTNAFGNNIFIDNININPKFPVDLSMSAILVPTVGTQCGTSFTPVITVRNVGQDSIKSYKVGYRLDALAPVISATITTPLAFNQTATISLAPVSAVTPGAHVLRAFTSGALGSASGTVPDIIFGNDTLVRNFNAVALVNAPLVENFVPTLFPPANWRIINPNANVTWIRSAAGNGNIGSAFFDNWSNNVAGQVDDLASPPINTDSTDEVIVNFDAAHKRYPGYNDSLIITYSNNCANSFLISSGLFGGADIGSGNSTANYTAPVLADWRNRTTIIPNTVPDGTNSSMIVGFRNKNAFGNNIFLDNINLKVQFKNDISPVQVLSPFLACGTSITPRVIVRNNGSYLTNSFTTSYRIDNGAVSSLNTTGLSLPRFATTTLTLPTQTTTPGLHTLTVYTSNLISASSLGGDKDQTNDTLVITFNAVTISGTPVSEGFEGTSATAFPPANWTVVNQDAPARTWKSAPVGAANTTKSATVANFGYVAPANRNSDFLITPIISYSNADSVYVSFDLAAKTRVYPGSTQLGLDTLEVLMLKDCGNTYTTLWKKWGEDLQTITDPNYSQVDSFVPLQNQWKNIKLNITQIAGTSNSSIAIVFKNTTNGDNNVYVDNVNLTPITLPAKLKQQGYILYPSPFSGSFNIQHYLAPTDLRGIEAFDSRGRLVYRKQFGNNGANATEKVDISREASGVYTIKLTYTNKQIVERIIKTN